MNPVLLKGGRVIDPVNGRDGAYDVLIAGGVIEAVETPGRRESRAGVAVLDVARCWVMPGLIDPHVHLRDPGFPEKETIASGLRAAAAGGFTAVAAMANTLPVNDSPEVTRYIIERARDVRAARLLPVSAVTRGLRGAELVDFAAMAEAGVRLFSDDGMPLDSEVLLARALRQLERMGFALSLHEEERQLSADGAVNEGDVAARLGVKGYPVAAETRRVERDLALAMETRAAIHIAHLSCAESIELVGAARKRGARVTCEVTPHHFSLDETAVFKWGPNAKMNPPLRNRSDVEAVHCAMANGTIDMIASDHAPHDLASKRIDRLAGCFGQNGVPPKLDCAEAEALVQAANGVVGLETALGLALSLVHRGTMTPARLAEMMALNPAKLLRLEAGTLSPGARADVTIIDPELEWTVDPAKFLSRSRNTPFAGMELTGKAILTLVGGEIVYDGRGARPV